MYVGEILVSPLVELQTAMKVAFADADFFASLVIVHGFP